VPVVQASWNQDLSFSGDLTGHMTGIVADTGSQTSACTGARPRPGQNWADKFYGTIDSSGTIWGVFFVISNFGGPGVYQGTAITIEVNSIDNTKVWENQTGDAVTFTLDRTAQSGTIDALMTSASTGKGGALHLLGHWNCKA
jgi:hypothetical protein